MKNSSGLEPLGRAVLTEYYEPPKKEKSLIEIPDFVADRQLMLEQMVKVIAIGPSSWADEPAPRAAVGDVVMISKMAGVHVPGPLDGKRYRVVNDRDVFVKVTGE